MGRDVFPITQLTWIDRQLARDGDDRSDVNRYIMEMYARPLEIYFSATPDRRYMEPADAVQGFFADRLDRSDFLNDWQSSGLRLRRWLMTGLCYYLKEQRRVRRRNKDQEVPDDLADDATDAAAALDRAFVVSIVSEALRQAERSCAADGYEQYWQLFTQHYVSGRPYSLLAPEFDVDERRAAVMVRTAAGRFRSALCDLLAKDGVPLAQIDSEIRVLLEVAGQ